MSPPERDRFIRIFQMLILSTAFLIGCDFYLRRPAEATSTGSSRGCEPSQLTENLSLRKDLEQALTILSVCFNTPVNLAHVRSVPITLTAYSSTPSECDNSPHFTASSKPVRPGIISVSMDLLKEMGLKFGQRVLIPGHGIFEVQDRTNPRLRRTVDIWMADRKAALLFGRQRGTLLWIASPEPPIAAASS